MPDIPTLSIGGMDCLPQVVMGVGETIVELTGCDLVLSGAGITFYSAFVYVARPHPRTMRRSDVCRPLLQRLGPGRDQRPVLFQGGGRHWDHRRALTTDQCC